jgi:hypothetical protein
MKTNKLNAIQSIAIIAFVAVIGLAFTACDDGSTNNNNSNGTQNNQTPVASDFNISGTRSVIFDGNFKELTVTAKEGKTAGDITVYYLGTNYQRDAQPPTQIGTYTVTFDVEAATGWDAVEGLYAGSLTITDGLPSVPSNVSVSVASATSLKVSWSTVTGATSYNVYFIDEDCEELELAGTVTTTSYTHTGLTADKVYFYYVTAINTYGQSNYSTFKAAKISIPDTPASVEATASSSTAISLRWSSVTGATSYKVYCATSETGAKTEVPGSLTSSSGSVTGLTANTTYYFFIKAVNALGESDYSPAGSAKTFPGVRGTPMQLVAEDMTPDIRLRWTEFTGSTLVRYSLYCSVGSPNNFQLIYFRLTTIYWYTNAPRNTTLYFYVEAENDLNGAFIGSSDIVVVRTGAAPPPPPPTQPSSPLPTTPPSGGGSGEKICTASNCLAGDCKACYGLGTKDCSAFSIAFPCNSSCKRCHGTQTATCGFCNGSGKCTRCNGTMRI